MGPTLCRQKSILTHLKGDIDYFSNLHSWYKHLNINPDKNVYYALPSKGEQIAHPCHGDSKLNTELHWKFFYNLDDISVFKEIIRLDYDRQVKLAEETCIKLASDLIKHGYNYNKLMKL